jgi:hypothetical protein
VDIISTLVGVGVDMPKVIIQWRDEYPLAEGGVEKKITREKGG